ncbi:MAG TPA: hypothetical protein P5230_03470 [Candidatus Magasanikbacteria bacterium]|nr:hypothetical protein [Candidatus Magasanikbacteria bacterium]
MNTRFLKGGLLVIALVFLFGNSIPAKAIKIENLENVNLANDFVVGPGKQEIVLDPSQSVMKFINVTNRFPQARKFKLELEDFQGKNEIDSPIQLLGLLKGPYSLKDYIKPEAMEFTLQSGDRATIAVQISAPKDAVPGGLYGSVIVTTQPDVEDQKTDPTLIKGGVDVKSRIAVLYFVRVSGPVKEDGALTAFKTDKKLYQKGPMELFYTYKNNGSVYLNPYGYVEIKNLYGTVVDRVKIDPYYVLPGSERSMKKSWDHGFMLGRYKAEIFLNRGYTADNANKEIDVIDRQIVTFWVMPWKVVVPTLLGIVLLIWLIVWIKKNVHINIGQKPQA